jgi:alpha-beta hydrolase superfamily lysophospholipase
MRALPLDDVPVIKVYLDLPLFGARMPSGGTAELARRQNADVALQFFEPVVVGAADELPAVVARLQEEGCVLPREPIGLFGYSAGGAAALISLAEARVPVGAAVVLNSSTGLTASVQAFERATGAAYAWSAASQALARRTDAVTHAAEIAAGRPPPALLIVHGTDDPLLPAHLASDLFAALLPLYGRADAEERLRLDLRPISHSWADDPAAPVVRAEISAWFYRFTVARHPD